MTAARTVHRLQLRASNDAQARRMVPRFEDALRTAGLPDGGGRLLIVRRINLPPVAGDISAQGLSLAIEKAFERCRSEWRYAGGDRSLDRDAGEPVADEDPAEQSGMVWFADALDAHCSAARRLLRGDRLDAWFWPKAIVGVSADAGVREGLRYLALSLARLPEAATALPTWAAQVFAHGGHDELPNALSINDAMVLARSAGLSWTPSPAVRRVAERVASSSTASACPSMESHLVARASVKSLLVRLAVAGGYRTAPASRREHVSGERSTLPLRAASRPPVRHEADAVRQTPTASTAATTVDTIETRRVDGESTGLPAPPAPRPAKPGQHAWPFGTPTAAGGLLFLLPLLQRIGYGDWLDASPEWARFTIARHLFSRLLSSLEIDLDDPAWLLAQPVAGNAAPLQFTAPPQWHALCTTPSHKAQGGADTLLYDASGRCLLAAWRGESDREPAFPDAVPGGVTGRLDWRTSAARIDAVAAAWQVVCRRWLRRHARIGLADLVRRPALLHGSATHIDLTFDLDAIDLRLRRNGLDFDPGWVPWFGQVVAFHFERSAAIGAIDGWA